MAKKKAPAEDRSRPLFDEGKQKRGKTKAPPIAESHELPVAKAADVKIASQEYRVADVASLKVHPDNPKKGNLDAIGESIAANDFYGAIVVQKSSGFILAGNHRWKSAVEKGMKQIPAIVVDCDDATARRILLADNRVAELGGYDDKVLASLMALAQADGGLRGTGFGESDLQRLQAKVSPPEQFPEFNEQVHVSYTCPKCGFTWT